MASFPSVKLRGQPPSANIRMARPSPGVRTITSSSQPPAASVVIRCHNEASHIGHLLEGLENQEFTDFEVIVVDSGSDDGTIEIVEKHGSTLIHIPKADFSFGRSLNWGCSRASGEFLVFISAHCYPIDSAWLTNLLDGFRDPKVAAVYGLQRGIDSSHFSERQVFRTWFPVHSESRQNNPFSNNANCAIRRELWEKYPYDEELTGLEDVAWAQAVMREGWWLSYRADAGVIHVHNESPSEIRNRYRREAITFQKIFPNEHFNTLDVVRLTAKNVLTDWRRAASEGVLRYEWLNVVRFRTAQFIGTYEGYRTRTAVTSELKRRFYYPGEP